MVLLNSENGLQVIDSLALIFLQGALSQGYTQPFCIHKPP